MTEKLFTARIGCCNVAESTNQQGVTMKFTKAHEGKTIYAVPTGNNARRWGAGDRDEPARLVVVKVKRKYVDMHMEGKEWDIDSYCQNTGSTQSEINADFGGNSGWRFYASLEEIERERELKEKLSKIKSFFGSLGVNGEIEQAIINKTMDVIEKELNK